MDTPFLIGFGQVKIGVYVALGTPIEILNDFSEVRIIKVWTSYNQLWIDISRDEEKSQGEIILKDFCH